MVTWTGSNGVGENWLLSGCFEVRVSLCCKVHHLCSHCSFGRTWLFNIPPGIPNTAGYLTFSHNAELRRWCCQLVILRDLDGGSNLALTWLSWHCSQVSLESRNRNGRSTRHSVLQRFGKRETGHQEGSTSAQNSAVLEFCRLDWLSSSRFSELIPPRQQGFSCCLLSDHLFPSFKASRAYNLVFFSSLSLDFVVLQQYCLRWQNLTPVHRATRGINGLTSFKFTEEKDPSEDCMLSDDTSSFYTEKSHSNPVLSLDDWFFNQVWHCSREMGGWCLRSWCQGQLRSFPSGRLWCPGFSEDCASSCPSTPVFLLTGQCYWDLGVLGLLRYHLELLIKLVTVGTSTVHIAAPKEQTIDSARFWSF